MASLLIIEDGSGVEGANSYQSAADARSYADARGFSLPADDAALERLLVRACDYLETLRDDYQGSKTDAANERQFPRTGVVIDGREVADDEIPKLIKYAQAQLAVDIQDTDPEPTGDGKEVVRKKIEGATETQYAEQGDTNPQPVFTKAMNFLAPLLSTEDSDSLFTMAVVRM